jgi:hypothetical protein
MHEGVKVEQYTRHGLMAEGAAARRAGLSRLACPKDMVLRGWWLEGYDCAEDPETLAKVFPAGGPLLGEDGPLLVEPVREGWDG